jgi:hypothetical protein
LDKINELIDTKEKSAKIPENLILHKKRIPTTFILVEHTELQLGQLVWKVATCKNTENYQRLYLTQKRNVSSLRTLFS